MPFTPFHFGPGLAVKAMVPRGFSLILFIGLQVIIDLESLSNLIRGRYPVHRFLHTFAGATILAVLVTVMIWLATRKWLFAARWVIPANTPKGQALAGLLGTALFATWSHVALDSIMHGDAQPFWPIVTANPLLELIGVGRLHGICLLLGLLGAVVLAFQWSLDDRRS